MEPSTFRRLGVFVCCPPAFNGRFRSRCIQSLWKLVFNETTKENSGYELPRSLLQLCPVSYDETVNFVCSKRQLTPATLICFRAGAGYVSRPSQRRRFRRLVLA